MELAFTKTDNLFISEFQVNSDFNLHVERDELGKFVIWVKTTPVGNYAKVNHEENLDDLYVIDYNFTGTIYPKYIKIVSKVEPTYAAITTDGEVTEIKTQSKEIEITSNGTTVITPDSGFAYLDRVSVKTNVATSGGGGGSASTMEYLVLSAADNVKSVVTLFSAFAKVYIDDMVIVLPTYVFAAEGEIGPGEYPYAVAIDFSAKVISEEPMTIKDLIILNGITIDQLAAIPRITEEEFYNTSVSSPSIPE